MEIRRELLQFGPSVQMPPLYEGTDVTEECSCDSPCCEVDVGVGFVTCGAQHCPMHATPENQGIPGQRTYAEGSLHGVDTVEGKSINERPHGLGPGEEWHG